ncbi:hypothetical protein QQ054_31160 [Oscillatoria amoena NRMC-F 0135]|nr:hypothetical protein [Geitlerinema splendidum]MDL5050466.1 hypothetical protein [Oscillatoria amoena NRMC-F 0135]
MSKYRLKQKNLFRFRFSESLLIVAVAIAMLWWNWPLLFATSVGLFLMLFLFWAQANQWQKYLESLRRLIQGANRHLLLAVGGGGAATLGSYLAISIWLETENPWIATGGILQGLGTLLILLVLLGQWLTPAQSPTGTDVEELLLELTASEPLRRFIAVKRLTRSLRRQAGDDGVASREQYRTVLDAWRLMLSTESEPTVRNAILEGLKLLSPQRPPRRSAASEGQPISLPLDLKSAVKAPEV